jgi:hypothetical protein
MDVFPHSGAEARSVETAATDSVASRLMLRETEMLRLIADYRTNRERSDRLSSTSGQWRDAYNEPLAKLGLRSKAEATAFRSPSAPNLTHAFHATALLANAENLRCLCDAVD